MTDFDNSPLSIGPNQGQMSNALNLPTQSKPSNGAHLGHLLALLSLPQMGPSRLAKLLSGTSAQDIWHFFQQGDIKGVGTSVGLPLGERELLSSECQVLAKQAEVSEKQMLKWCRLSRQLQPEEKLSAYMEQQVSVAELSSPSYPKRLYDDIEPPAILFWKGSLNVLENYPTAAIVGTRSCSNYGREVAFELGQSLAASGVAVVSGLALGIDTAAHKGVLSANKAPPVGVVGSGLNMIYPKSNRVLWEEVASKGLLLSETPLDIAPERWRFPARNRVIAALADVVVIVESMEKGGALFTAEEAAQRGKPVFAVPGPIRSPASYGTNRLLAEGCMPLCDVNDVLVALGIPTSNALNVSESQATELSLEKQKLLEAFGWQPAGLDQLIERSGMSLSDVAVYLEELQSSGHIIRRGLWYERGSQN